MADVRLVDLEVIKKFSLAVRQDTAPAHELLAALDASRATVLAAIGEDGGAAAAPAKAPARRRAKPPAAADPTPPKAKRPLTTSSTRRRTGGGRGE